MLKTIIVALFILFIPAHAENIANISSIVNDSVLIINEWNTDHAELKCLVVLNKTTRDKIFIIFEKMLDKNSNQFYKEIFKRNNFDWPITFMPIENRLVTIWETGSAFRMVIYQYISNKIISLIEDGSRSYPEILFDSKNNEAIIISDWNWINQKLEKDKSRIYKWNGQKYIKKEVKWEDRLKSINE